jgi:uncharacterized membrane protein YhaH (DUF805 family)
MPFTISHAAAVLPFTRPLARWRLLSATIIGSMVPDFGFFSPWRPPRVETHSWPGLVLFCLPVGLLTFWVFQRLIKPALLEVLPNATYARWQDFARPADIGNRRQWAVAAVGILVGAFTHLVWDAFTHEGARGVRMIPALDDPYVDFAGHHLFGPRLLQDGSSLLGLTVVLIIVLYGLRPARGNATIPERRLRSLERYGWVFAYVAVAAVLTALVLRRALSRYDLPHSLGLLAGLSAISTLRGLAASLLLVSLALQSRLRAGR